MYVVVVDVVVVVALVIIIGGASLTGRCRFHELTPVCTVLCSIPRRIEVKIVSLEVEFNCSSWSTSNALKM